MRHGYGVWKRLAPSDTGCQDSYLGEWRAGKAHGYGVHSWANGDKYEGEWKSCCKHGRGTDTFGNGDTYTGEYKAGKPDGQGTYTWANGSYYEGCFKDGLKQGKGKWKKYTVPPVATNGQVAPPTNQFLYYEGDYQADKKHGAGSFTWPSGNTYKGDYREDERDGHGEMRWTDGSCYLGQWVRGIQHGYGKIVFPDGTIKEGYFENNIYIGPLPRSEYVKEKENTAVKNTCKTREMSDKDTKYKNMLLSPSSLAIKGTESVDKKRSKSHNYNNGSETKLPRRNSKGHF